MEYNAIYKQMFSNLTSYVIVWNSRAFYVMFFYFHYYSSYWYDIADLSVFCYLL